MSDERFCIENDVDGEPTIWRIGAGYANAEKAVLSRYQVRDLDLWDLICAAVAE